jgi:hypothetical protein
MPQNWYNSFNLISIVIPSVGFVVHLIFDSKETRMRPKVAELGQLLQRDAGCDVLSTSSC